MPNPPMTSNGQPPSSPSPSSSPPSSSPRLPPSSPDAEANTEDIGHAGTGGEGGGDDVDASAASTNTAEEGGGGTTTTTITTAGDSTADGDGGTWIEIIDQTTGHPYYFNSKTNEVTWEPQPNATTTAR